MTQIPIENIYYLLSYAWDKLDEAELIGINPDDFEDVANLLGKVLANGCTRLFKMGLYRNYHEIEEEIPGIRGRLLIDESLRKLSFQNKKAWCRHDELDHNVLPNKILKATVLRLLQTEEVEAKLHGELKVIYERFTGIDTIQLQRQNFTQVRIHRNNAFYGFLLQVCRLIFESTAMHEKGDRYQFRDFTRDHQKLATLFEAFIYNFYEKEQTHYSVSRPTINWPFYSEIPAHNDLLPIMRTDIVLQDEERILIIDTKYYSETLARRSDFNTIKFKSPNLYQIFAYMQHISNPRNKAIEGMLLYPDVGDSIHAEYTWEEQKLTLKTIPLDQPWRGIESELLTCVLLNEGQK
ncbi:MAG: hypothetical protein K9N46_05535 [Candidatus Marinimicrobia bacterium]|nr:hypothetical protein [Candidatus Neomarinimicrobiota bacterium]MCF7880185.1 hypothetical protein [Candidatus Neomarinimicrobiota bacterium]